ncbi:hypothetical protein CYLTODRAFT_422525 [Cylindrobasidium torrendii FP15055 ss-10]|uniref:SUR7-domain-containing protein n=1 Tax=Cylindrobasidium torrendii FP15055 ss-10 TaxID=1314674 RepID=A0A0D7BAZ3_9AGAR|nr:hypothetical protein CYLTODRAFT_422525 [Cylindrobasidium torrendii FP15055 ss-10]
MHIKLRAEVCLSLSTVLSLLTFILLIFVHIAQINLSSTPRDLYFANMDVTNYGAALTEALVDTPSGLYASNATQPLLESHGLRSYYRFGMYAHCGYLVNATQSNDTTSSGSPAGICSNSSAAHQFRPYEYMVNDLTPFFTTVTHAILDGTTFADSNSLGKPTGAAYYFILLATILTFIAIPMGLVKRYITLAASVTLVSISTIFLLVGAAIWTVVINKADMINDVMIGDPSNPVSVGIRVTHGSALTILWVAFGASFLSILPHGMSCCTYRG